VPVVPTKKVVEAAEVMAGVDDFGSVCVVTLTAAL
jgi:hypothetical protein